MNKISQNALKESFRRGEDSLKPKKIKITVGMATCGIASGAMEVYQALLDEAGKQGLDCVISKTGCIGFCQQEPLVDVLEPSKAKITYAHVTPQKARGIVESLAKGSGTKAEWALCYTAANQKPPHDAEALPEFNQHPFFNKQKRVLLDNCGLIQPDSLDEYIACGGYSALQKMLKEMSPENVIDEVTRSKLRGRGGAGFLTGLKWSLCRKSKSDIKYLICNADEGDPGAFMDRSILEGNPHAIIEGMLIGAYAIGCSRGFVYIRAEYPLAITHLTAAMKAAEEQGLLGENILGSDFSFSVEIFKGAGAFVCGEETALISSLSGNIGSPAPRPPYPAQSGLWDKPTNINNVETWANVPLIINHGAEWFASAGTDKSKGTKVFSLVGKVRNTGLVEVPMGMTLREIVHDIGGGTFKGRTFKAVQTGGPSGGCIPESQLDLPVDFDALREAGAMMGSGGLIVMDDRTCMVDVARYFTDFLVGESCGKCTPCREGLKHMLETLNSICNGEGDEQSIETLERLAQGVRHGSLCALGGTAANPVLSTITHFRDEYEMHIHHKTCPAGVCKPITRYTISALCTGCTLCRKDCPVDAISGEKKQVHVLDQQKCTVCGICYNNCPFSAIIVDHPAPKDSHATINH